MATTLDDFDRYDSLYYTHSEEEPATSYLIFNCGTYYIYKKDEEYYLLSEEQMTCETFGDKTWLDDYEFIQPLELFFRTREENVTRLFPEFNFDNFKKHSRYRLETAKLLISKLNYTVISSIIKDYVRKLLCLDDVFVEFDTDPAHLSIMQVVRHDVRKFVYDIKRETVTTDAFEVC